MTGMLMQLLAGDRQANDKDGARSVGSIGGMDRPAHRLHDATADRQAEARAGALPIRRLHTIELVEDMLQIGWRNAGALVADTSMVTLASSGLARSLIDGVRVANILPRCRTG